MGLLLCLFLSRHQALSFAFNCHIISMVFLYRVRVDGQRRPGRGMVCQGASFMTGSFLCVDLNYIINSYRDCFFKIWSSKPVQLILLV